LNRATGVPRAAASGGKRPYTAAATRSDKENVVYSRLSPAASRQWLPWLLLSLSTPFGYTAELSGLTVGGNLTVTTDYIYRGVTESGDHPALQGDAHVESDGGTFIGAWASTRDHHFDPYADYDLELYLGHRFALSSAWGATLSGRSHYFIGGNQEQSADYQELSAAVTYLDRWSFEVVAIPNAVHYWFELHLGRSPAWVADTAAQWQLLEQGLFATGGAGYYYAEGTGPGIGAGGGYVYGNAGLAFERRRWRVDVGYFVAQREARRLFPYPIPDDHIAGTLTWRF
jgi:Bacterial protein of unknown function (Gcw_chp)